MAGMSDQQKLTVQWGLQPPETAIGAWGARAIYTPPDGIDLVYDRKSVAGAHEDVIKWLSRTGLEKLRKLLRGARLGQDSDEMVYVSDGRFTLAATPRRSFGYLFIGAWEEAGKE